MAVLYAVAAWLIMQVAEVLIDLAKLPDWIGTTTLWLLAIGFPIALIFSWFYELTPEGMKLDNDVDAAESTRRVSDRRLSFLVISLLCAAVILFAYDKWWIPGPPERSVAVIPFMNIGGNPDNDYLVDGITETLRNTVAQLPGLKVPGRTSSFHNKGQGMGVREIAAQLDVANVLEGSVQVVDNKLRVVAQLVDAKTGFQRWGGTFDRDMSNIFTVQDEIVKSVTDAMQVTLSGKGAVKIEPVGTDNVAAYDNYLQGMQHLHKHGNTDLLQAEISFRAALARDPDFYEASVQRASTYMQQASIGEITVADAIEKAAPLVKKLRKERPDDGLALILEIAIQYARAKVQGDGSFDLDKHLAELSTAVERTPNEAGLYVAIGDYLRDAGRPDEFAEWVERGIVVDPLNWGLHMRRGGYLLFGRGDLDGAEAAFTKVLELNPDNPGTLDRIGSIHFQRKQFDQWFAFARKGMDLNPLDAEIPGGFAIALSWFELNDEADKYLQRATEISPDNAIVRYAKLYRLLLGDDGRARDLSKSLLQADIENRFYMYWGSAIVFVSTMVELGETDKALAVLEDMQPGVTSPDFMPKNDKQWVLQYVAVLALAQSQSREDTLTLLDEVVPRWDQDFPHWRVSGPNLEGRNNSWKVVPIEMARGNTRRAIEQAVENLADVEDVMRFRHLYFWKALAQEPAVAARLEELEAEAKKGGKDIWAYIEGNDLQLD
jgi:TolB-like protein/tetratricopeptide (TPR) repeat protein